MDQSGTKREHIGYLDGWRGIAILVVLQSHFLPTRYVETGRLGVDIFFALSGLLMAQLLFIKETPLAVFYQRRISRILPAFLAFVCIVYAVEHYIGREHGWEDFLASVTFLRSYVPISPGIWDTGMPIGHLWSLNVEEHAYLLMSLLTLLVRGRRAGMALIAIGLASFAVQIVYMRWWAPVGWRLHTEVLIGHIVLAAGYRLIRLPRVPSWLPLVTFAATIICYAHTSWMAYSIFSPILLAFTVNHLSDVAPAVRSALSWGPLRQMGIWSFSVYLWQQPFYEMRHQMDALSGLCLAIATGLASFYFLEQPVRAWLNARSPWLSGWVRARAPAGDVM